MKGGGGVKPATPAAGVAASRAPARKFDWEKMNLAERTAGGTIDRRRRRDGPRPASNAQAKTRNGEEKGDSSQRISVVWKRTHAMSKITVFITYSHDSDEHRTSARA